MQNFVSIAGADKIKNSRQILVDDLNTIMSQSSGIAFPIADLQLGMPCYRSDQKKLYVLTQTGPDVWELLFDFNDAFNADKLDGLESTQFARTDVANVLAGDQTMQTSTPTIFLDSVNASDNKHVYFRAQGTNKGILYHDSVGLQMVLRAYDDTDGATRAQVKVKQDGNIELAPSGAGVVSIGGSRVLTQADEGAGNGLDADTLDGLQASQFLRSDQSVTLNGSFTVSGDQTITGVSPQLYFHETDAPVDEGRFDILTDGGNFDVRAYNDARTVYTTPIRITRTGTVIDEVKLQASSTRMTGNAVVEGTYLYGPSGKVVAKLSDSWLRINDGLGFTSGIYCGGSVLRTDGQLQVGSNGATFLAKAGTCTFEGNRILTVADEGAGNGLDADTVDGIQGSLIVRNDQANTIAGKLTVDGIEVGSGLSEGIFFKNGFHRMTNNDGGGNFNLRIGNYFDATHKYSGNASGATHLKWDEGVNPVFNISLSEDATTKLAGDTITWAATFSFRNDGRLSGVQTPTSNTDAANKLYIDNGLAGKANTSHTHTESDITDLDKYTQAQVDTALGLKLDSSAYTAADVLAKIKTVDGAGSGLDADTVDGIQGSSIITSSNIGSQSVSYADDAGTLDGIDSTAFLRSNASDTHSGGVMKFQNSNGIHMENLTGQTNGLQIYQPTAGADACMSFHVAGDYAVHLGLDGGTNQLAVGGWSLGSGNKYRLYTEQNVKKSTAAPSGGQDGDIWLQYA